MRNKIIGGLGLVLVLIIFITTISIFKKDKATTGNVAQNENLEARVGSALDSLSNTSSTKPTNTVSPVVVPATTTKTVLPTNTKTTTDVITKTSQATPATDDTISSKIVLPRVTPETIEPDLPNNLSNTPDWVNVGIPGFSPGKAWNESIAIDSNNVPYVAYRDGANGNKATVMKFNGTSWVNVGAPGFSAGLVGDISLAIDSNNTPYIVFEDNNEKVTAMKFNGTSWVNVGAPGFSPGRVNNISLAIDSNDIPYVEYKNFGSSSSYGHTVMKFNGTSWVNVGNPGFGSDLDYDSTGSTSHRLAIDSNNIPYVVFEDNKNGFTATVMKFNGTNWVNVGTPGFSAGGETDMIAIALDSNNIPYVAYSLGPYDNKAIVMKFNGISWVLVGDIASQPEVWSPSLAFDSNNNPYIAYTDPSATVKKWNGVNWINVGTPNFSGSSGYAEYPSFAIDSNDTIYTAYEDGGHNQKVTVMKYITPPPILSSITITDPNGGETFNVGQQFTANWTSTGTLPTDNISFDLVNSGTSTHYSLTTSTPNDGTQVFTIPSTLPSGQYKLYGKFVGTTTNDYSDNSFTIIRPSLTISDPNGGESFNVGQQFTATWTSTVFLPTDNLSLDLVNSTSSTHYSLTTSTPNDGTEVFTIPNTVPPGQYKLYGKFTGTTTEDYSDNNFTIQDYTGWINVGSPNSWFSAGQVSYTSLALNSSNTQYVTYQDGANNNKATVKKFDGTNWVQVGTPGFSAGASSYNSIAIGPNNIPYVAYRDGANGNKATVKKFDGTNWVNVGTPGFSAGQVEYTSLAIDGNNVPYIAYKDVANSNKATVMKWNGTSWVNVGNAGFSAGGTMFESLAIGSNNTPYIAYEDVANGNKVTVMKFNGTAWVNVGNAGLSTSTAQYISLALDGNNIPYVAYSDIGVHAGKLTVAKFNGTNWTYVGNYGFSSGAANYISLALDGNNIPYVAFRNEGNSGKATVMKWNGTTWVTLDTPTGPGISIGGANYISLAIGSDNNPYVAYKDLANNVNKAIVREYVY